MLLQLYFGSVLSLLLYSLSETASNLLFLCSILLFHGYFPFLFYDCGEVITSPEFIFFASFKFQAIVRLAIVRSIVDLLPSNAL